LNEHEKDLILDPNAREAVKRSMLRKSMALWSMENKHSELSEK
jgi:hypothetical protein